MNMGHREILLNISKAHFRKNKQIGEKSPKFVFPNEINNFNLTTPTKSSGFWAIIGPRKSDFLNIVASKYVSVPLSARKYSDSISSIPGRIAFLDFRESSGLDRVHLAARYESHSFKGEMEMSEDVNSLRNYITGANNYNKNSEVNEDINFGCELTRLLGLNSLLDVWVTSLSNGQMRRARIARALYRKPSILAIDDPFLGLDPATAASVANSLHKVCADLDISIVLGLRMQDAIPEWVTHSAYVNDLGVVSLGLKKKVTDFICEQFPNQLEKKPHKDRRLAYTEIARPVVAKPHLEFLGASVFYKGKPVLNRLSWCIEKGSKWRIIGDNGSGKTTLVALITADHPQSWKSTVKLNGVLRKPGSGATYFGINDQIGLSSPELHANVPMQMSMREIILNGLITGTGNSNFVHKWEEDAVLPTLAKTLFEKFETELMTHGSKKFLELSTSLQKLTLFLRAVVKNPSILILDEAFSCMDDNLLMSKCHNFITENLQGTTVLSIGHIDWEVPPHDYAIKLTSDEQRSYEFLKPTR